MIGERYKSYRKFNGQRFRYVQGHTTKDMAKSQANDSFHKNKKHRIVKGKSVFGVHYRLYVKDKRKKEKLI